MSAGNDLVSVVCSQVAQFIVDDLGWDGTVEQLIGDEPAELPKILDSQDLLELAGYVEHEFNVEIADEEIVAQNFATVETLARLVEDKVRTDERSA